MLLRLDRPRSRSGRPAAIQRRFPPEDSRQSPARADSRPIRRGFSPESALAAPRDRHFRRPGRPATAGPAGRPGSSSRVPRRAPRAKPAGTPAATGRRPGPGWAAGDLGWQWRPCLHLEEHSGPIKPSRPCPARPVWRFLPVADPRPLPMAPRGSEGRESAGRHLIAHVSAAGCHSQIPSRPGRVAAPAAWPVRVPACAAVCFAPTRCRYVQTTLAAQLWRRI